MWLRVCSAPARTIVAVFGSRPVSDLSNDGLRGRRRVTIAVVAELDFWGDWQWAGE